MLGPVGAALLGAEDRDEKKWLPQARADRMLGLERSQRLGHMTGRNWFFTALAARARDGGGELHDWVNETGSARHALGGLLPSVAVWDRLPNPDGAGTWAEDGRAVSFLLEYDTGSEDLARLAGKLVGYAVLASVLADDGRAGPVLLFCFTSPRREQSARRALAAARDSAAVRIATAALDPRLICPAGPVWLPLGHGPGGQVRLIDLDTVIGDPWQQYRQDRARQRQDARHATLSAGTDDDDDDDDGGGEARSWPRS